jgi:hemerythrin superfamily protein
MKGASMLIYDLLKHDHRMVEGLIDAIRQVRDADRRKDICSLLRMELMMHSKAEETVFYSPLQERAEELVEDSYDEHHKIEHLLMKLQTSSAEKPEWMETLRELRDVIEHHVRQEEGELFRIARREFSEREAKELAFEFLEEKGKLGMTNPLALIGHKVKDMLHRDHKHDDRR